MYFDTSPPLTPWPSKTPKMLKSFSLYSRKESWFSFWGKSGIYPVWDIVWYLDTTHGVGPAEDLRINANSPVRSFSGWDPTEKPLLWEVWIDLGVKLLLIAVLFASWLLGIRSKRGPRLKFSGSSTSLPTGV